MVSICSWWRSHYCLYLALWTFYLFLLMFLVCLYQEPHVIFFYTCLTLQRLFLGESSWIVHGTLSCFSGARWLPVTFYAVLLIFNAMCQYFFFDTLIYLPLHEQSDWYTPGWLLGSRFGLFWHRILCEFLPDVNVMSLFTFLNSFLIFGPIWFFLLVSLRLTLLLFLILYSLTKASRNVLLCSFSTNMFTENCVLPWYIFLNILCGLDVEIP